MEQLSTRSPDRGIPCLVLFSTAFQLGLYITKKVRSRGDGAGYLHQLRQTLVESATNVYGLIVLVGCFFGTSIFALHHVWTIRRNRTTETSSLTPSLLPLNIAFLLATMAFITLLPFCTKHALRSPLVLSPDVQGLREEGGGEGGGPRAGGEQGEQEGGALHTPGHSLT